MKCDRFVLIIGFVLLQGVMPGLCNEPAQGPELYDAGMAALYGMNPAKAEEIFRQMTEKTPDSSKGWDGLGMALILLKRNTEAAAALGRAIALEPQNARLHANRAQALRAANNLPEAIAEAGASVHLDPSNPLTSNRLLLMRIQNGETEAVRREIESLQSSGVNSLKADWIYAAAALAARDGKMDLCLKFLAEGGNQLPPEIRRQILNDPVFVPYHSQILSASPKLPVQRGGRPLEFLPFR